ncbi:DEAD/DEAH box RNA helicase [Deinococcus sp. KNUC1210]|uniref:DEAD/DEAH box helicase n=1 Tax=Deinococcus sp. KNUC1210 TaxID=2917691 RepID=UPI001EEFACD5|nr:DEAD/DEAH box helicase [Deinococcus sp. KNUC1210]ULH16160.1 DEAD/DEAH box RNA helicase [Deinococcus sp. KNUC1210]
MQFTELVSPELAALLAERGILEASPIQEQTLPFTLQGRDLIGRARTGTGKTLAFALPILSKLTPSRDRGRLPRAIVMAPTRELAKQVSEEFSKSGPAIETLTIYGGAAYGPQEKALQRGVDVVVGTPGRIMDHIERGNLSLENVQFAVLDEADEMLSVGFADAIESILSSTPKERQTMLFSATIPDGLARIARNYLDNPLTVDLVGDSRMQAATSVEHLKIRAGRTRTRLLADLLTVYNPERAIIFTRTKREVDELALELIHRGIEAEALHGDLAQSQRERALGAFRSGRVRVLVATDVAARGLDIPEVDLVVQYHLPQDPESYVHRSGRTGRAGRTGTAIVLFGDREQRELRNLEHATGVHFKERAHPTAKEVREAGAQTAANEVRAVGTEFAEPFRTEAERLFSELGIEALSRALARINGATQPTRSVSLLSGEENVVAVMLEGGRMGVPRAVALISRSTNIESRLLGKVRLTTNGIGAVADVPTEVAQKLLKLSPLDGEVTVTIPDELPELQEPREREGSRSFGSRDGGSRGGYQGGRSYGNQGGGQGGRGRFGGNGSREGGRDGGSSRPRSDFSDREFRPRDDERRR